MLAAVHGGLPDEHEVAARELAQLVEPRGDGARAESFQRLREDPLGVPHDGELEVGEGLRGALHGRVRALHAPWIGARRRQHR